MMLLIYDKRNLYYARNWKNRDQLDNFETKFMDTLENSLNLAIDYCAAALNWVINQAGDFECKDINDMA